jgi:hypothetical protein
MEMYPKKEPVAGRFLMTAILGDETATVQVSIWSPLLQKIEPDLLARFEESDLYPGARLVNFDIVALSLGTESKPVGKLQSGRQSQVHLSDGAVVVMKPSPLGVMASFSALGSHANGQVWNLRGVVQEVGPIEYSKVQEPMKAFKLVDAEGFVLPMKQHGAGVFEDGIQDLHEVIVWSALRKEGLKSATREMDEENGSFWAYAENYILILKTISPKVPIQEVRTIF